MIYLCRHGQTVFNTLGRLQGHLDSPLTALGQCQAAAMGATLRGLAGRDFRIFASPLGRARATAEVIAGALGGAPVTLDPRLMEIGMGAWDGMTDFEIEVEFPGAREGLDHRDWCFHGPGGETGPAFARRLSAAMADIARDAARVHIVVSHAMSGRVIRGAWAGLGWRDTLALTAPQDVVFALDQGGAVREIPCKMAPGA